MSSHNHDSSSQSVPWNFNLSFAVDWSIVLGVPVVLLTARHIVVALRRLVINRRRRVHPSFRITNSNNIIKNNNNNIIESDEEDEGQFHQGQLQCTQESGVDISPRHSFASSTSKRWSYSRLENWIVNKLSATLYLGSYVHLVAGATLLALIFLSVLAVLLLLNGDLLLNSNRAGYLALSCIPFLFAFTGKNSIITYMTGMSHHRINQVHRFLGLCLFILVSVHMGCMFYTWMPWKTLLEDKMSTPKVRFGLATYTTLCLIVVTAAWPVRRWAYEVFVISHSLFLVFLVLVGLHTPYAMRFTVAGIFFYVINALTGWCVKTHMAVAQATVYQNRLTRLRVDRAVPHAPGQHIYVCVPSISLIQWHPFTISGSDQNSLTVHARAVGGFTKKLCWWPDNTQRRVILSGPYGKGVQAGRGSDLNKVIFLAAGSGFAYIVPTLVDLLKNRRQTKSSNCPVEVVWCVRDLDEVQWFQEEIEMALDIAQGFMDVMEKDKEEVDLITPEGPEIRLCLKIHYTNTYFGDQEESFVVTAPAPAPAPALPDSDSSSGHISPGSATTKSATITADKLAPHLPFAGDDRVEWVGSRLDVTEYIQRHIVETPRDKALEIVGCGPPQLLAQLHNAVANKEQLSGCCVHLHTERFYM